MGGRPPAYRRHRRRLGARGAGPRGDRAPAAAWRRLGTRPGRQARGHGVRVAAGAAAAAGGLTGVETGRPASKPLELPARSEEHTSELQSLMRISYAVFCLKKKKNKIRQ